MFGLLKKKLRESVEKLTKKVTAEPHPTGVEEKGAKSFETIESEIEHIEKEQEGILEHEEEPLEEIDEVPEDEAESIQEPTIKSSKFEPEESLEKELGVKKPRGLKERLLKKITTKTLTERDIDDFFSDIEMDLLQSNVALEVIDFLKSYLKENLVNKEIKRGEAEDLIESTFKGALMEIVDVGNLDMEKELSKKTSCVVFLGFNGSGKTTSIAKVANFLKERGYRSVMAAGDTFRAAAIQQLEHHGKKLGINVIKHDYGADSAAVIFDAKKHAEAKKLNVVLADTAGRTHTNSNLMDELKKIIRVNSPDIKILVIDSITGNDAVEQARTFDKEIGVDAIMMTKVDVNEKGGSILSVCYAIKKPIVFLGVGQKYDDLIEFKPKEFVENLLSED